MATPSQQDIDHDVDVTEGYAYDRAILRYRANPTRQNYALREEARQEYYAVLRGFFLDEDEPQPEDV